ncbi:MAG: polyprenyl synthetase family protein [Chitinophagales bacterium]|jgi:octaprenyl-diphosphate synthase|nr:polyprenyl synthetase family protein [Chitinophagales bacterium]
MFSLFSSKKERDLSDIQAPINDDLAQFERVFRQAMRSKITLLDTIMRYLVRRKGKQMRPMFVFFAAKLGGDITPATHRGAALIELLHTATLVHDDVVDDAYERRGFFSINAIWKNKISVLVGDYLLSRGLLLAIDNGDFQALQLLSRAVREMSEGELLQIERSRHLNLDESVYYEIIRQKTASLIASACAVGFASTNSDKTLQQKVWQIGEKIGMAFQIKDDLFDFGDSQQTGKPTGIDIKEKKMTLPLIYSLNNASGSDKRRMIYIIKQHSANPKRVEEVVNFVHQSGGIAYAQEVMNQYRQAALEQLREFPDNEGRRGLEELISFTIERKK